MAETTTTLRLMAAAKEFNIGKDTLVEFLVGKGFSRDDLKPNAKLTDDMYRSLQQEFQSDKVAKIKSDQIDLPKGSLDAKKKKEEETLLFKKDIVKKPVKEEPPVVAEPVTPPPPVVEEKQEEPPRQKPAAEEIVEIEAPKLEGPKVIDKIDLSNIDSSTRPKKPAAKKPGTDNNVEPVREETEEITAPAAIVEKETPKEKEPREEAPRETPPVTAEKPQPPVEV